MHYIINLLTLTFSNTNSHKHILPLIYKSFTHRVTYSNVVNYFLICFLEYALLLIPLPLNSFAGHSLPHPSYIHPYTHTHSYSVLPCKLTYTRTHSHPLLFHMLSHSHLYPQVFPLMLTQPGEHRALIGSSLTLTPFSFTCSHIPTYTLRYFPLCSLNLVNTEP